MQIFDAIGRQYHGDIYTAVIPDWAVGSILDWAVGSIRTGLWVTGLGCGIRGSEYIYFTRVDFLKHLWILATYRRSK